MGRRTAVAMWVAEGVAAVACAALVAERLTTLHTRAWLDVLATSVVVAALVAAALAAAARRPAPMTAPLALAAIVAGATTADEPRLAVAGFALAVFVPLVALTIGGLRPRAALATLGLATVFAGVARLVLRDPFRELNCEPFCDANPFLLARHHDAVRAAELLLVTTSVCALVIGVRRTRFGVVSVAYVAAAIATTHLAIRQRPVPGSRLDVAFDALLLATVGAYVTARALTAWATLTARRQMRVFGRTVAAAHDVAAIEAGLRRASGDPGLAVALGSHPPGPVDTGQVTTSVVRNGTTVAVVGHRPERRDRVAGAITPSVALALETQGLLEQARRLVTEVERSRADAARSTDASRRALERNLHDGAQQQLLLAGMMLADAAGRTPDGDAYHAAAADLAEALHELRRIGRGDAATVAELGLADAVSALAGRSPVPVTTAVERCHDAGHECWPSATATAAYRLVVSTIAEAARGGATVVRIGARCLGPDSGLRVTITHDAPPSGGHDLDRDRVLAAGGSVSFGTQLDEPRVIAWLP